jgi:glycosyltransferase involved in cell wall biosynthesis
MRCGRIILRCTRIVPRHVISVVIPTLNDERRLVPTLASLVSGAADGLIVEAIVADGGSTDDTEGVADVAGCRFTPGPADRGARLAAAAAAAKAPWLLFVSPGVVLDEGWIREVRSFLEATARRPERRGRAAVFALGREDYGVTGGIAVAAVRLGFLAGFGPDPRQGLLIQAERYRGLGGHQPGPRPERRFARRIGRFGTTVLRSRATAISA